MEFGFSEIGWSTLPAFGGELGQYQFLHNLSSSLTIDQDIDLHLFCYCWLHDLEGGDTTGLIHRNGTEKLGYQAWKQISNNSLWGKQPNERIVFMSRADSEDGELYLLDKTGSITRLTNNQRHENNPALSFDGSMVAFHGGDEENPLTWEIYALNLTTLEETQLTENDVLDGHPDWSPDGERIVYASFQDNQGNPAGVADLYVITRDGNPVIQLTENEWEDNDPEWSPDGKKIAFKSTRRTHESAREELFVMNSDGTNVAQLTTTTGWESDHDPSWSPDSNFIAFMRYEGIRPWTDIGDLQTLINHWDELTPWNTYVVDLNGAVQQVTDTEYIAQLAVFSSDGKKILYLDNEFIFNDKRLLGIYHRFTIINPDGTLSQQILPDDAHTPTVEYFDW
jgi:Tol biopolymer transport system component